MGYYKDVRKVQNKQENRTCWKNIQYLQDINSSLGKLNENPKHFKTNSTNSSLTLTQEKKTTGAEPRKF